MLFAASPWYAWAMAAAVLVGLILLNELARFNKWTGFAMFVVLPVILTICGWFGIIISKDKQKDMIWPDMMWFWIIAYDLWNFAYLYNCVTDRAVYGGLILLLSCTIPAFFIKKGAWLQHRASTLAIWMMIVMAFPSFFTEGEFAIASTHNPTMYWIVSIVAFLANVAVAVYQVYKIIKTRRNPFKGELYIDEGSYRRIYADNINPDGTPSPAALEYPQLENIKLPNGSNTPNRKEANHTTS